jgi:endonuclease/exonuclease/phosphatase (EEP) superfamily protein YafD
MQFQRSILKTWALLPAALVAMALIAADPFPSARATGQCSQALGMGPTLHDEALSGDLEILSWNIQKASNEGWAEDLAEISSGIHLAFIQEASVQAQIPMAIDIPLVQAFAAGYTTASQETGVMTLSSSAPSVHCNFTAWEPWLGTPKATSITEYHLEGREERLLAVNLHAVNFAIGTEEFEEQFKALDDVLDRHEGPVILAGDLNTWSEKRQDLVDQFLQAFDLEPVVFEPDLRTTAFGRALDHIYIRGMSAQQARVIPVSSSDHNPLRVRLALH